MRVRVALCAVLLFAFAAAQDLRPGRQLTKQDVVDALRGSVTIKRVITLVQQYGIDFGVTEDVSGQVRAAGGDEELITALKAQARKEARSEERRVGKECRL